MAYITQYAAARTVNFLQILEMSLVKNANDVINEAKDAPNHFNRAILATNILQNSTTWAGMFKDAIAMLGVTDTSLDTAFDTAVSTVWNGFAGTTHNGSLV